MPIDLQTIAGRKEIKDFYSTLSKVESVAKSFVSDAQDETEAIDRAVKIEQKLRGDCAPGTVYNPVTGNCE